MGRRPEAAIAKIAARQHGAFSRAQAVGAGITIDGIRWRLGTGRWTSPHPGVFVVAGCPRTYEQRLMAACLYGGPGVVTSQRSAATVRELPALRPALVQLTGPAERRLRRPGIDAVRTPSLAAQDVATRAGIPVTSVCRTIIDCAAEMPSERLGEMLDEARRRRLVALGVVARRVDELAAPGRAGIVVMRSLLASRDVPPATVFESRLATLLAVAGLAPPTRQLRVELVDRIVYLDFSYPDRRLCIEADSEAFHLDLAAFRRDRRRQNLLVLAGWTVLRYTWADLVHEPSHVVAEVREALLACGSRLLQVGPARSAAALWRRTPDRDHEA